MSIGDVAPDDQFVANNIPDPEQVARRLHEERRWLGSGDPEWDDLEVGERLIGELLIQILLEWLLREGTIV